ncbi:MAG: HPr family phosphocarrier protein [Opitutaceae bacterium]
MKRSHVVVPWSHGLHLRPAAALVKAARRFRSAVLLRSGDKVADLRNILSIIALCATLGTPLAIEATGDDEQEAADAVERVFTSEQGAGT